MRFLLRQPPLAGTRPDRPAAAERSARPVPRCRNAAACNGCRRGRAGSTRFSTARMAPSNAIQIRFQMKVQIQTAMVDALEADRDFAVLGGFVDAGRSRSCFGWAHSWSSIKRIRFQKLKLVQPLVDAAMIDQLFVRSDLARCGPDPEPRSCRRAGWWRAGGRSR